MTPFLVNLQAFENRLVRLLHLGRVAGYFDVFGAIDLQVECIVVLG